MTVLSENQIENGEYTQDDILDYYEDFHNNDVHRNSLKNLDRSQFDSIDEHREGDYTYTIGTKDGVSVVLETKGFFGKGLLESFAQTQMDAAETKTKAMQNVGQGIKNFSQGTVFGLAKAYNNTKIILNEASGGRLKQFEDIVNAAGKNFLDIDVQIPIESLKPEANTIGTMGGEITGQYIIPGAFVYKYIPNILLAEPVVVGLFSGKDDGNLATAIKELAPNFAQNNEVAKIILDGLSTNADDDEVEARIKNIVADAPLGIVFGGLFSMLSYFKRNPKKLQEVQNEYKDAGAAATPEELKEGFTSTQPFFSNAVNAIRNIDIPENGINKEQFKNTVINTTGVKQSELNDMGFDNFINSIDGDVVTQQQINNFLETKDLSKNVKTTVLGEDINPNSQGIQFNTDADVIDRDLVGATSYDDARNIVMNNERLYNSFQAFKEYNKTAAEFIGADEEDFLQAFLKENGIEASSSTSPTIFGKYVEPGGTDYKELLLTMKGTQIFTKDHFRQATGSSSNVVPEGHNLLAHVRFNTRTMNGKKILFIEELQSDLHQTGRKQGYANQDGGEVNQNLFGRVPDAPFKKNWHELSTKRIIKYAIDNGFDGISFTPGSVQANRYNLAKQIENIKITKNTDGTVNLTANPINEDFDQIVKNNISLEELEGIIGKDLAVSIQDDVAKISNDTLNKTEKKITKLKEKYTKLDNDLFEILRATNTKSDKKYYPRATRNFYYKVPAPGLKVHYSYQTPIAYEYNGEIVMRVNDYSVTTNRHMSYLGVGADDRIPGWRFEEKLREVESISGALEIIDVAKVKKNINVQEMRAELKNIENQISELETQNIIKYEGVDLEIGGEGMKSFYDKMLPAAINKFSKKYGVTLQEGAGQLPDPLQSNEFYNTDILEFTPEMINQIKSEGVPVAALENRETSATRTV